MLAAAVTGAIALIVVFLVFGDFSRAERESSYWHDEGQARGAGLVTFGGHGDATVGTFHREPGGTSRPAGQHDPAQAGQPGRVRQSAGGPQHERHGRATRPSRSSHRELKDWPVRSRLLLLVVTPAAGVALMAFCVVRLAVALHDRSILLAISVGVAAIIVLVLALWLTMVAARSVLKPVYGLQAGVREAGEVWLPEALRRISESHGESVPSEVKPVEVGSSDEIGDVAHAFNQMSGEMVRLAANQAALSGRLDAMFVRLAHRSQSLVERQIRLIESLEQVEQDRERLTTLFKMNRIAGRLHRNSQNLLVVAGHELPSDWNQPISLVNVIGAAVAEIEDYERVSVNEQPYVAVSGPAVNDVTHLLAELIENATSFSGGDMTVEISGHRLASGGVLVDVTDRGVGMASKELAYANWRLDNPPTTDINVPQWMGLFVVAMLATRHGIKVRLQPAESGGLTALTWLPDEVITDLGVAPPTRPRWAP
jgi:signal transduction histidine kinase